MQARTAPTSPAAKKKAEAVTQVWAEGNIQQPLRTPWGRLTMVIIGLTVLINLLLIVGLGWYVHRYPQTWISRFAPLTSTTTTVIQPAKENPRTVIPAAIQKLVGTAYGLTRNQGQDGIYRDSDVLGLTWPLSSGGWTVSVNGAWPADIKSLSLLPAVGQTQAVTSTVSDPGSQFVFFKSTELSAPPVSLGSANDIEAGASVWVIDRQSAVMRQIVDLVEPRWASSDRDETYFTLDSPLNVAVGSAVATPDGRLIGLVGANGRVWPTPVIQNVIKQVVQQAIISRPVLGLQTLDLSTARVSGEPTATGLLIGADEGESAVAAKSPADVAGLKAGDVMTSVDNQIPTGSMFFIVANHKPGDKLSITYIRQQKTKTVTVTLGSSRS